MMGYRRQTRTLVLALIGALLLVGIATQTEAQEGSPERGQGGGETAESRTQEHQHSVGEPANAADQSEANDGIYVIQPGDTLSQISEQLGTSVDYLARYNGIADPDVIYSEQALYFELHNSRGVPYAAGSSCKVHNLGATSCEIAGNEPEDAEAEEEEEEEGKRPDQPDEAMELRFAQNSNEEGEIPENALVEATEQAEEMEEAPLPGAATPGGDKDVISTAAAGIDRGSWTWRGPGNVGGRVRSLVIHPTSPQTMWAGSVAGGIWKTTDGGASWSALDDFMANLTVSTMVIDPTNPSVLYAGTGEGFYNFDGLRGAGIFKTTDGGTTWSQLSSTNNTSFYWVNRLAISPANNQVLLAATRTGIWRSTDGGSSWSQRLATSGFDSSDFLQVAFDPTNGNKAVASGKGGRAYYSTDGGLNWTAATKSWGTGRVEFAYAPSNPSIVYASVDQGGGQIYKSINGGQSYSLASASSDNYLSNQGWYDNTIWVDPANSDIVVVGGIDIWGSNNGGQSLIRLSDWRCGGLNSTSTFCGGALSAHADHHTIVSHPGYNGTTNRTVFFGNDGGIYKTQDIYTMEQYSGWQQLNNNFGVTQFYGGAGNTTSGTVVGGTQDNGSLTDTGDPQSWNDMFGGDGGFSAADPTNQNYFYGEYTHLQIHRSTNGGESSSYIWSGITDAQNSNALFIAPFILDPNNPNTMLAGGASLWRSTNVKAGTPTWTSIKGPDTGKISAIAVAPGNSNVIWVGYDNSKIYRTTNGTSATPTWTRMDNTGTPTLPARYVTRITIDPDDSNKVYATFGGFSQDNIYRTTNGGSTWTDITGSGTTGLPDAPVRSLVIHPSNSDWLYVGTEVGIFASEDGGTTWALPTDGPANVSVDELFWMGNKLVAATHGRGMFEADTVSTVQRPANDDLASAQELTGASATVTGSNEGATEETGEPDHAGNAGGKSVWYKWTPQTSGTATIDTAGSVKSDGSILDTLLGVYTIHPVHSTLTEVESNDDEDNANGVLTSKVEFAATAGTTYQIAVDGYNLNGAGAASGDITLNLESSDPTAPDAPTIDSPADNSYDTDGNITLSGTSEASSTVELFDGSTSEGTTTADTSGDWSKTITGETPGSHTYTAKATDAAGNTSSASNAINVIVDITTPNTTIDSGPSGTTTSTSATFTFSSTETGSTFRCSLDNAAFASCTSPKSYSSLSAGSHTFRVEAIDRAGNTDPTPASRTWTVETSDTTAPTVSSFTPTSGATNISTSSNVEATFSEDMDSSTITDQNFTLAKQGSSTPVTPTQVSFDSATKKATLDPGSDLEANTTYTATITTGVKDRAGNALAQQVSWSFTTAGSSSDTTPPTVSLTAPADGATVSGSSVALSADATDDKGIKEVNFYVWESDAWVWVSTDTTAGGSSGKEYSTNWDSTTMPDGQTWIYADAYDEADNRTYTDARPITVDNSSASVAPTIQSSVPTPNKTRVRRGANIRATFSEVMDKTTLTKYNVALYKDGVGRAIPAKVTPSTDGRSATLNPYSGKRTLLAAKTWYMAVIWIGPAGVKDADDNLPLEGGGSYAESADGSYVYWWFQTGNK